MNLHASQHRYALLRHQPDNADQLAVTLRKENCILRSNATTILPLDIELLRPRHVLGHRMSNLYRHVR